MGQIKVMKNINQIKYNLNFNQNKYYNRIIIIILILIQDQKIPKFNKIRNRCLNKKDIAIFLKKLKILSIKNLKVIVILMKQKCFNNKLKEYKYINF